MLVEMESELEQEPKSQVKFLKEIMTKQAVEASDSNLNIWDNKLTDVEKSAEKPTEKATRPTQILVKKI
jgi:hypothetical protein